MDKKFVQELIVATAPLVVLGGLAGIGILSEHLDQRKTIKKLTEELNREKSKSTISFVRDQFVFDKQFDTIVANIDK